MTEDLYEEFPPDNFHLVEDVKAGEDSVRATPEAPRPVRMMKTSILEKLNVRNKDSPMKTPSSSSLESTNKLPLSDLKGMAGSFDSPKVSVSSREEPEESFEDRSAMLDELIKLHRQHLRDNTESGKSESKLLVNFTMKRHGSGRDGSHMSPEHYVRELDLHLSRKMDNIAELRDKISRLSSVYDRRGSD